MSIALQSICILFGNKVKVISLILQAVAADLCPCIIYCWDLSLRGQWIHFCLKKCDLSVFRHLDNVFTFTSILILWSILYTLYIRITVKNVESSVFYGVHSHRTKKQNGNKMETPMVVQIAIPIKDNQSLVKDLVENHKRKLSVSSFQFADSFFSFSFLSGNYLSILVKISISGLSWGSGSMLIWWNWTKLQCGLETLQILLGIVANFLLIHILEMMKEHTILNVYLTIDLHCVFRKNQKRKFLRGRWWPSWTDISGNIW